MRCLYRTQNTLGMLMWSNWASKARQLGRTRRARRIRKPFGYVLSMALLWLQLFEKMARCANANSSNFEVLTQNF